MTHISSISWSPRVLTQMRLSDKSGFSLKTIWAQERQVYVLATFSECIWTLRHLRTSRWACKFSTLSCSLSNLLSIRWPIETRETTFQALGLTQEHQAMATYLSQLKKTSLVIARMTAFLRNQTPRLSFKSVLYEVAVIRTWPRFIWENPRKTSLRLISLLK